MADFEVIGVVDPARYSDKAVAVIEAPAGWDEDLSQAEMDDMHRQDVRHESAGPCWRPSGANRGRVTYRPHGHIPSDEEVKRLGYRAFGPARRPFTPTADDFKRAAADMATGDDDELAGVARTIAALWDDDGPDLFAAYYRMMYGLDDDDWDWLV